jgi:hypothetical protein
MKSRNYNDGLTIVELLVTMAIALIIWAISTMVFIRPQQKVSLDGIVSPLIADIKSQQTKAMNGGDNASSYGIYFTSTSYVLFTGSTYSSSSPSNYVINLGSAVRFANITFPSSALVFQKGSGEPLNFDTAHDSFDIQNTSGGLSQSLTINKYGALQRN